MIIFNNTSADFVLISADVLLKITICNFDKTEDRATVFLKWTDFSFTRKKNSKEKKIKKHLIIFCLF